MPRDELDGVDTPLSGVDTAMTTNSHYLQGRRVAVPYMAGGLTTAIASNTAVGVTFNDDTPCSSEGGGARSHATS